MFPYFGEIMINIIFELNLAGVHLPGALHVDLLALEEIVHLAVLLLIDAGEGVGRLAAGVHLDIEGSVRAAGPGKVHVLDIVVLYKDRRFVYKDKAAFQGVHEARGGFERAGDGGGARVTHELAGNGNFSSGENLHEPGHQLKGRTLHRLLQLPFVLLLQTYNSTFTCLKQAGIFNSK